MNEKIKIHWNLWMARWICRDMSGANLYEIPDCAWMRRVFPGLKKDVVNIRQLPCSPENIAEYSLKQDGLE